VSKDDVMKALALVKDPEIGLSIVEMGLVYGVSVSGKKAKVTMTLTSPMCPLGGLIISEVEAAVRKAGYEPEVELVFDPPWSPDRMSPDLRKKLNL
jgi:metal-sulfur cluster biosynthetic enzyme